MKKLIAFALLFFSFNSYAVVDFAAVGSGLPNAANIPIPLGGGKSISLFDLSKISAKNFEELSGEKMGFFKRLSFKILQHKLAKSMDAKGNVTNKKLLKAFSNEDHSTGFHLGGFVLGFSLNLIGLLIAYLINDDVKTNRRKWAWIGFAIALSLVAILLIIVLLKFQRGF
jgi:hypothetical protein